MVELVGARDGVELYYVLTYLPDLQVRSEAFCRLQPCDRLQTVAAPQRARPANAKAADNRAAGRSWSGAACSSARPLALASCGRRRGSVPEGVRNVRLQWCHLNPMRRSGTFGADKGRHANRTRCVRFAIRAGPVAPHRRRGSRLAHVCAPHRSVVP